MAKQSQVEKALTIVETPRPINVFNSDKDALRALLWLHATPEPVIADVTFNRGRMWDGTAITPIRVDRNPQLLAEGFLDHVADFSALPFDAGAIDVIVWDPPHITDDGHGTGDEFSDWGERFGLAGVVGDNISFMFGPFLDEAKRVLKPDSGIVIAKLIDAVHGGALQLQNMLLWQAAIERDMTFCDVGYTIVLARGGRNDPRWKYVRHLRNVVTLWSVIRNGKNVCTSPTAPEVIRHAPVPLFDLSALDGADA
jgi:hypothetical protein